LPEPLSTAPAQVAFSMKDSLANAAQNMDSVVRSTTRTRTAPDPLMAIPETPSRGATYLATPMSAMGKQMSTRTPMQGYGSVPATPAYAYNLPTPSGTPMGQPLSAYSTMPTYTYAAPPAPVIEEAPSRATLSLTDMIQSPKADQKSMLLQNAYQQVWQAQPQQPQQLQQQHQYAPAPMMAQAAPAVSSYAAPAPQVLSPNTSAAVALGLVSRPPAPPAPAMQATLTQHAYVQPQHQPQQVMYQHPQATYVNSPTMTSTLTSAYATNSPTMTSTYSPTMTTAYTTSPTAFSTTMPPPPPAPPAPPAAPAGTAQRMMPPPPPMAPAPIMMSTPTGACRMPPMGVAMPSPKAPAGAPMMFSSTSPTQQAPAAANDIKVLLDLAMASGNQSAVDAVKRQAQQQGISMDTLTAGR